MRHRTHCCAVFRPEKELESPQCDTVLAKNDAGIMAKAKNLFMAMTYV
jgi:hypothetical protein